MKEGLVFGCLFSCFSEIYIIAPVGSALTPGHVRHGLEVNSTEFQWSCWPCLFGFYGETGRQICNRILLGYCYSAYYLSLSLFLYFSSFTLSISVWVIKLWGIIQFSSFGPPEDRMLFVFLAVGLFPLPSCKWVKHTCTLHHELPN